MKAKLKTHCLLDRAGKFQIKVNRYTEGHAGGEIDIRAEIFAGLKRPREITFLSGA